MRPEARESKSKSRRTPSEGAARACCPNRQERRTALSAERNALEELSHSDAPPTADMAVRRSEQFGLHAPQLCPLSDSGLTRTDPIESQHLVAGVRIGEVEWPGLRIGPPRQPFDQVARGFEKERLRAEAFEPELPDSFHALSFITRCADHRGELGNESGKVAQYYGI